MNEQILINVSPFETRIAVVEGKLLQDVFIERNRALKLRHNIYKGRITRVLPGIGCAFVDIGLEGAAFMNLYPGDGDSGMDLSDTMPSACSGQTPPPREGQTLMVQVVKDASGSKGVKVAATLAFSSRYLIYKPGRNFLGISRRITDEAERSRLKALGKELKAPGEGLKAPGEGLKAPGEGLKAPGEGLKAPGEELKAPGEELKAPGEGLKAPGEGLKAPGEGLKAPGEGLKAPGEGLKAPGEGLKAPGEELKAPGEGLDQSDEGIIVRTAAEGIEEKDFRRDLETLRATWRRTLARSEEVSEPALVYVDLPLPLQIVRDLMLPTTRRILIDCKHQYERLVQFVEDFSPEQANIVELANAQPPLFDTVNLEDQIERALDRKVPLRSGGYLVIDQTEAMTTVDVNTGSLVSQRNAGYRTNLEAAAVIPQQLRLRRIGGIIVVDFIDMADGEHQRQVLRTFEKGLASDPVPCQITALSDLGLVEMTRARRRESLQDSLCEPCQQCGGSGVVKSGETACLELFRELACRANEFRDRECLIAASQTVVDRLIDEEAKYLDEVSLALGTKIRINVESSYAPGQFDITGLNPGH